MQKQGEQRKQRAQEGIPATGMEVDRFAGDRMERKDQGRAEGVPFLFAEFRNRQVQGHGHGRMEKKVRQIESQGIQPPEHAVDKERHIGKGAIIAGRYVDLVLGKEKRRDVPDAVQQGVVDDHDKIVPDEAMAKHRAVHRQDKHGNNRDVKRGAFPFICAG